MIVLTSFCKKLSLLCENQVNWFLGSYSRSQGFQRTYSVRSTFSALNMYSFLDSSTNSMG